MFQSDGRDLAAQLEAGDRKVNRGADSGRLGRGNEKIFVYFWSTSNRGIDCSLHKQQL